MGDTQTVIRESLSEPRLWSGPGELAALRSRLTSGDEHLVALVGRCRELAVSDDGADAGGWGLRVQADLLLAVLARDATGERLTACLERLRARAAAEVIARSDLARANLTVVAAMVLDLGGQHLGEDEAAELATLVADLAHSFREAVGRGNPHHIVNNWWAVTHGACLIAALAAEGRAERPCAELAAWAGGRLWPFCHHFGDRGLYHEGLGYQGYTCSYLLPALLAWRRCGGRDALARFEQLGHAAASLMTAVTLRQAPSDSDTGESTWGASLSWNDAGFGAPDHAALPALIACARREYRGALRWCYDHLRGHVGDRRFAAGHGGLVLSALLYPYDEAPRHPEGVLPRCVTDGRTGYHLARARWRDGDDAVLGVLGRCTHVGGHAQDDAASLRFAALGQDWIVGGGQDRAEARWQSLPTPVDGERAQPRACGALIWDEPTPHGSVIAVDHRKACLCYSERYVAWRSAPEADGVHAALAILDLIDDHLERDWHWNLSVGPGLTIAIDEDHAGFVLRAASGATCHARFLVHRPEAIVVDHMPDSQRTFSGGGTVRYPGRPFLRARFAANRPLHVLVAACVDRGPTPVPELGPDLRIDCGPLAWERPFAAALPPGFTPRRSANLMTRPDGSG